jgi:hypothetical protein
MAGTLVASSDTDGALITIGLGQMAQLAWQAVSSGLNPSTLSAYINSAITDAEEGQPEGAMMELDISGWTNPITGTDYSLQVADYVNSNAGSILNSDGTPVEPWPGNGGRLASGGNDTLVLQWVKGQLGAVPLLVFVTAGIIALAIIVTALPNLLSRWRMYQSGVATATPGGSPGGGFSSWPLWEKIAVVSGGVLAGGGILWFLARRSIAEAGASKSYQEIVIQR